MRRGYGGQGLASRVDGGVQVGGRPGHPGERAQDVAEGGEIAVPQGVARRAGGHGTAGGGDGGVQVGPPPVQLEPLVQRPPQVGHVHRPLRILGLRVLYGAFEGVGRRVQVGGRERPLVPDEPGDPGVGVEQGVRHRGDPDRLGAGVDGRVEVGGVLPDAVAQAQ